MSFLSYAQNFEDVMLWRALGHVQDGRYLDIGAQDPEEFSVSMAFYEHGWRGMHVEPNTHYAEKLRKARPDEAVLEVALGEESGIVEFFDIEGTGLSTMQPEIAERHRQGGFEVASRVVPILTLDEVLERFTGQPLHWLKIDVEGAERQVLEGWRKSLVRPWILVVESTLPLTQQENHSEWESLVLGKGYRFAYFDGLNRFYVAEEHAELLKAFRYPPCVFDDVALAGSQNFNHIARAKAEQLEDRVAQLEDQVRFLDGENERREAALIDHREALDAARQQAEREASEAGGLRTQAAEQRGVIEFLQSENVRRETMLLDSQVALDAARQQIERESDELTRLRAEHAQQMEQASANEARLRTDHVQLQKVLLAAEQQLAQLRAEHAQQIEQASANEARLRADYVQLRKVLLATEQQLAQCKNELDATYRHEAEAREECDRWRTVAEGHKSQFAALVQSRSWRITRPLRVLRRLLRGEYALMGRMRQALSHNVKRLLRPLLLVIMRRVLGSSVWRDRLRGQMRRWPRVYRRLRGIAQNAELIGASETTPAPIIEPPYLSDKNEINFEEVPPRVRNIYWRLQQARQSTRRSG